MNVIILSLMLIAAFKLGETRGSKRNKSNESTPGIAVRITTSNDSISSRKISSDKKALDIMEEFADDNDLFSDFKIIETLKKTTKYQYLENGFLFTVVRTPEIGVEITITKEEHTLLRYKYKFQNSYQNSGYTEKYIVRSLIENHPRDDAMDIIDNYMRIITQKYSSIWNSFDYSLVIEDDIKEVKPVYIEEEVISNSDSENIKESIDNQLKEDESVSDNLTRLQNLIKNSESQMDSMIIEMFNSIINNMRTCLVHIDRLETEKQYSLENLLQKDLEKLFLAYKELNEHSKEEVSEKVTKALAIMDKEIKHVLDLFEKQNIREVEKMVQVIHSREY